LRPSRIARPFSTCAICDSICGIAARACCVCERICASSVLAMAPLAKRSSKMRSVPSKLRAVARAISSWRSS